MALPSFQTDSPTCPRQLVGWLGLALLLFTGSASAQPLDDPRRTAACDPADSPLYQSGSDLEAACEKRFYRLPAADSVALDHDRYGDITVEAWDSSGVALQATIVMRQPTQSRAQAALSRVQFHRADGRIRAKGPGDDAPGWWSVRYQLRVPQNTALALTTNSGSIQVRGVSGPHRLISDDGALTLHLPPNAGAHLQAETGYGTIDVGFPVTVQGTISNRLDTVIGDGGPRIQMTTGDDITIRRGL